MELRQLKEQLLEVNRLSILIYGANKDSNVLFDAIDDLSKQVKEDLRVKYANAIGPVLAIRKELVREFLPGPVNRSHIINQFETNKRSNPKRYQPYKNLYSILYPFVIYATNKFVYDTLETLAKRLRTGLQLDGKADIKVVGFDGARNTGSDRAWFAIYNNSHPDQKSAKQLFFCITNGVVEYALNDRRKQVLKDRVTIDTASLDETTLLAYFSQFKDDILVDNYRANILAKYPVASLIEKVRARNINVWLIKPGEGGAMWKDALKEENIRIGWGKVVEQIFDENNFDHEFVLQKLKEYYPNLSNSQTNNKNSILSFLQEVAENDVVLAVAGTTDIIGLGIVTSKADLDEEVDEFKAFHDVDWLVDLSKTPHKPGTALPIKTVTQADPETAIQYISAILQYSPLSAIETIELPYINTILYGPPGTGKTYLLNQYKEKKFTDKGLVRSMTDVLHESVAEYPMWKILAAVLNTFDRPVSVTELLEHPLIKSKLNPVSGTHRNTVWSILQSYAEEGATEMAAKYKNSLQLFRKNGESKWSILPSKKQELADIIDAKLFELAANPDNPNRPSVQVAAPRIRYTFITFHQKYSYEDFIEGIRPLLKNGGEDEEAGDLQFKLKKGILYNCCLESLRLLGYNSFEECFRLSQEDRKDIFKKAQKDPSKQYALFIDEINRANISAVFGELITLLEEDKRMGAKNEMWLDLPYSQEKFCVPGNLYIIGAMNTADRSIALLDIALRRRFEFKATYPNYPDDQWWTPLLLALNDAIYGWRKNPDFFIGHAFFLERPKSDMTRIMNAKIIPLLIEYCQNNIDTVKNILAAANVRIKPSDIKDNFQIIAE